MANFIGEAVKIATSQSMAAAVGMALMLGQAREATTQYVRIAASVFAAACTIWFIDVTLVSVGLADIYLAAVLGILALIVYVCSRYQTHSNGTS